jgi:regulator of sigma E protease
MLDGLVNVVLVLLVLLLLVGIHELGHFIAARRANVRVHEFGIGLPPRALVLRRGRETAYTLNWLPIGGFVRMEGEEGESLDRRAFVNQPLPVRLVILLAGVAMNLLLAWLVFALIAGFADPVSNTRIGSVQPDSPAAAAGIVGGTQVDTTEDGIPIYDASGDLIVAIDGRRFPLFETIEVWDAPLAYLRERAGQAVVLTVRGADGAERDVPVTLRPPEEARERGALGIVVRLPIEQEDVQRGPVDAAVIGMQRTVDASTLILRGVADFVSNLADPQVAGPVGIVNVVGVVRTELPPIFFLWFIGLLSANLGVINALPFPPLDGSRVAMALVQAATRGRVSPATERLVYLTGFVMLIALMVWITIFDIRRMGGG